jgi:nicotinamide riboside transporter PnuC
MKFIEIFKKNKLSMILMAITGALIIACVILFKPDFISVLPYFVSLIIGALQASANRYAPLIGGFNSILYAIVFKYYLGLNGYALYALLVSFPIQIVTFIRWQKNKYGSSTIFKKMNWWGRGLTAAVFVISVIGFRIILNMMDGSQQLFDSITTLFGILISVLTMLSYVEYSYLAPVSGIVSIIMYIQAVSMPGGAVKAHTLIFSVYSFICVTRGMICTNKLYKEQQKTLKESEN